MEAPPAMNGKELNRVIAEGAAIIAQTKRADAIHARNCELNPHKRRPVRLPTQSGRFATTPVELMQQFPTTTRTATATATATGKGVSSSYTPTAPAPTGPLSEVDAKAQAQREWDAGKPIYRAQSTTRATYTEWRWRELTGQVQKCGGGKVQSWPAEDVKGATR